MKLNAYSASSRLDFMPSLQGTGYWVAPRQKLLVECMLFCQIPLSTVTLSVALGDLNEMNITPLLDTALDLKQIFQQPTRKKKILDICITNLHTCYRPPSILPP